MSSTVTEESLKKHGWGGLSLRPYQLEGVQWLVSCYSNNHGCILGDEMGLGKTCQTIAVLTWLTHTSNKQPHLVVCPRSLLENWCQEFDRFAPGLRVQCYAGDKEKRSDVMKSIKQSRHGLSYNFDVLLTTYEICLKDYLFLQSLSWHVLVVDEGHRLKNSQSLLYQTLEQWDIHCRVLLTGTPVQNDLRELYSLLSFVDKKRFRPSRADDFVNQYTTATVEKTEELHGLLKPYLLRRTKAGVLPDLPDKSDVILFHGLSPLQKRLYKAVLTKDIRAFENTTGTGHTRLMNILMQLRKCVNHPYLFDGVEPEPFEVGEHLVESSGKLVLIDCLLRWLKAHEHKVLLFSQMTHMLDILQDYLTFRGFTYERLDGSVRGEERFLAVQNFNKNDETFVFLLSTKAGGQGLNLTAADTVVFVDSDFNPQNDLQAAARAHRIGQNRPVKVIRLVGRNTVEEIILRRAEEKLELTEAVIEKGEFDIVHPSSSKASVCRNKSQLQDILKFGMDKLMNGETEEEDVDLDHILGLTLDGHWQTAEEGAKVEGREKMEEESPQTMYVFEGEDYSKKTRDTSAADREAFSTLIQMSIAEEEGSASRERSLRKHGTVALASCLPESLRRPRTTLTPEQLQARKEKRQAEAEVKAQRALEERQRQKEQLWKKYAYTSVNIIVDGEGEEAEELTEVTELDDDDIDQEARAIHYVIGDVTRPCDTAQTPVNIIVHCADNSGNWGRGGLFTAISSQSGLPQQQYELAGKVKDLTLGDCHLVPMVPEDLSSDGEDANSTGSNSSISKNMVALIIAQSRGRNKQLSGIKLSALQAGLEKLYVKARQLNASVHLPRIGHDTPLFNWYGTERLIHKILAARNIPTFVYYFARKKAVKRQRYSTDLPTPSPIALKPDDSDDICALDDEEISATSKHRVTTSTSTNHHLQLSAAVSKPVSLPDYFSGIAVFLYDIPLDDMTKYKRFIIAFDGDVDSVVHSRTTHLVVSPNSDKQAVREVLRDHSCCVVTSCWLDQCFKQRRLVDTEGYLFNL